LPLPCASLLIGSGRCARRRSDSSGETDGAQPPLVRPTLFTDESVFGPIVAALRAAGWDIERAVDVCPAAPDDVILRIAYERQRVVVTEDFDFGELVVRYRMNAHGLVVVSLDDVGAAAKPERVVSVLDGHTSNLRGNLLRIEPARVRIRPLEGPLAPWPRNQPKANQPN
jgi:predicted nuclease of predicted toxin-antitoxin system